MSENDFEGFVKRVGSMAKTAAVGAGGAAGYSVGTAASANFMAGGLAAAALPSAPALLVIVPTAVGAYVAYKAAAAIFGRD